MKWFRRWVPTLLLAPALGTIAMLSLPYVGSSDAGLSVVGLWAWTPLALGVLAAWARLTWEADIAARAKPWRRLFGLVFAFWVGAYAYGLFWITDLTIPGWVVAVLVEAVIMTLPLAFALGVVNGGGLRSAFTKTRDSGIAVSALALASALVLGEALRWVIPFGGVPLSSLSLLSVGQPWTSLARVGGPLALVAVSGVLAVTVDAIFLVRRRWGIALRDQLWLGKTRSVLWVFGPTLFVLLIGAAALGLPYGSSRSTLEVAVVQSGGELGTRGRSGDVFADHIAVTLEHRDELAGVDLLVWSESSLDSDGPLERSTQLSQLEALATEIDTTIVANFYERTVEQEPPRFRNATVIVAPGGGFDSSSGGGFDSSPGGGFDSSLGGGYLGRYDKAHLVPFGEYIPLRSFIDRFADLSLVPRDAIAGEGRGLLPSPFGPLAVVSSFEIYFPERARSGVEAGGGLLVNPTLASTYTSNWVAEQSLASARLRAIESGRWVLQASTTGYSAVVDPNGTVVGVTTLGEADVIFATAELRSGRTLAYVWGTGPVVVLAAIAYALALFRQRRAV